MRPLSELNDLLSEMTLMMDKGMYKPVMDRSFLLEEAVKAHQYIDKGHKIGNVTLTHT